MPIHWNPGRWTRAAAVRAAYWQAFESSRQRWYEQATKLIATQFEAERQELLNRLGQVSSRQALPEQCSQVFDEQRTHWQMAFHQILEPTGIHFAQRSLFGYTDSLEEEPSSEAARSRLHQPVEDWTRQMEALLGERLITNTRQWLLSLFNQPSQPSNQVPLVNAIQEQYQAWCNERAPLLATYMVVAASNYGAQLAARRSGRALSKQWVAVPGGDLQDPHAAMDGQITGLGDAFGVNRERLLFPGDLTQGASCPNLRGCRCTQIYQLAQQRRLLTGLAIDLSVWDRISADQSLESVQQYGQQQLQWLLPQTLVNLEGLDQMGIRMLGEALFRMYKDFPQPLKQLKLIAAAGSFEARFVSEKHLPDHVYARYYPSDQAFLVNPRWFGHSRQFQARLAREARLGFRPQGCNQVNSVVAHELGHLIWTWLKRQPNARTHLKQWLAAHPPDQSLSLYGAYSAEEMWAEGMAAQYYGSTQAKQHPYVKAQWQFLEAFWGEPL